LLELKEWSKNTKFPAKPWLILGKGPSFSRRYEIRLEDYNTFALNHVVREQSVDIAHVIDIDVLEPCGDALLYNCNWLIMPRRPHVHCFVSDYMDLYDWVNCIPVLAEVERRGKLVTYSFAHEPVEDDPWTVDARYFSSEIALGLLARMGVKTVQSVGIDGGSNYSNVFADLSQNTLLANGQPNFDLQFNQLKELANRYSIEYKPIFQPAESDCLTARAIDTANTSSTNHKHAPSTAAKIQTLECDLREKVRELKQTSELLYFVTKELSVCCQRLDWSHDEIKEYREKILELEQQVHALLRSKTWKIGRAVTKPVEAIIKPFSAE